jgi:hypothetical protein
MVHGPQGALFGFGGQGGMGPPMGYNMMPGMLPQGMQMPGNALAYMPWFPQMGQMGQMGMQGYGMGGMPGMPPGQADGMQGGTDDAQRKRRERDETNMKWSSLDQLAPPATCTSPPCDATNPANLARAPVRRCFTKERGEILRGESPWGARAGAPRVATLRSLRNPRGIRCRDSCEVNSPI